MQRAIQALPVLLISSIGIFLIVHLVPGDPALVIAGPDATPEAVASVRTNLGLDEPLWNQFFVWLGNVFTGDFGTSYISNLAVSELIASRLPATVQLAVAALLISVVLGFLGGVLAAVFESRPIDWMISSTSAVSIAVPEFWVGILLILGGALYLGILPPGGYVSFAEDPLQAASFILLPALALSVNTAAVLARFMRSSMLEVFGEDYIRTAEAKGVRPHLVVTQHVLRNALIPVLTILGIQFGRLLGGSIVIETVFAWPGIGRLLVDSISNRDYSVVQGVMLLLVVIFVVINLIVDLLYGAVDPRVRLLTGRST
ncbi:ABC transporter permease [Ruania alba]|uniref:ABC transporter permease n=1 Tax=Ruania alba TaxID=648782 RepID=UPI001C31A588|nr:ABC transporter permease [Ruania alba]